MVTVDTMLHYVQHQKQQHDVSQREQDSSHMFLSPFCLSLVKKVLAMCHMLWTIADERERKKAVEQESLYRFKPRTFEISEREEDTIVERQLQEMFPSFEEQFQDEEDDQKSDDSYEDRPDSSIQSTSPPSSSFSSSISQFTDDEMHLILSLHLTTFTPTLTPSFPPSSTHRVLEVIRQRLQRREKAAISSPHDHQLVGGLAKLCHELITRVTSSSEGLPSNR